MSQALTIIGNLADDPELRFTPQGKAVARFTVLTSRSTKNQAGEWENTGTTGWYISAWDQMAENVAESLTKGTPVIVYGRAEWRSWQKDDGTKGGRIEVTAHHVGVDLKRRTVKIETPQRHPASVSQPDDPWATAGQAPF